MKVGNPKQAIVLSVIALAAVVFLVVRMLPDSDKPIALSTTASQSSALGTGIKVAMLVGDPFSSPKLAISDPKPASSAGNKLPFDSSHVPTIPSAGAIAGLPGAAIVQAIPDPQPEEKTLANRRVPTDVRKTLSIRLEATASAGKAAAMISLNDSEALTYRVGDVLAGVGKVVAIDGDGVQIKAGPKTVHVAVGEVIER